jgi:hypothetical protein
MYDKRKKHEKGKEGKRKFKEEGKTGYNYAGDLSTAPCS